MQRLIGLAVFAVILPPLAMAEQMARVQLTPNETLLVAIDASCPQCVPSLAPNGADAASSTR
jgi:hypothetical protein